MVAPEARWQALLPVLRHWPLAVAFSGGLDSRFLCFALRRAGCDVLALHATGPHVPQAESEAARRWARAQGLPLLEVRHDPLSLPEVAVNSRERCYACKRALMRRLREALAAAGGCRILCDGSNADDLTAFRPGQRAVREAGVLSPLALAGQSGQIGLGSGQTGQQGRFRAHAVGQPGQQAGTGGLLRVVQAPGRAQIAQLLFVEPGQRQG